MGIYATFDYGEEDQRYGEAPRLAFSVAPFTASAIDYTSVQLNWAAPEGSISKIRLVRSQDGFPETEEDGVILWEWSDPSQPRINSFEDSPTSSDLPLTSGRFAYYRVWLLQGTTNRWLIAGETYAIVPRAHDTVSNDGTVIVSTHQKFLDLIPRVFTSASQSPLDAVDESSDLSRFLRGFSFTLDEIMTLADNVLPEESGRFINPELIGLRAQNFGLEAESYLATQSQKRLIREATFMYANKGSRAAIETYAESLTGFAPTIVSSPNLLLSVQDSSFYKGLGNWQVTGNAALTLEQTIVPVPEAIEAEAVDYAYTAKLVSTGASSIINGLMSPKMYGTPITAGTTYSLSTYVKRESSTSRTVTPVIYWHDFSGALIGTSVGSGTALSSTGWTKVSSTATAPGAPSTVTSYSVTDTTVELTVASTAGFTVGDTLLVFGVDGDVDGEWEITALTPTVISYEIIDSLTVSATAVSGVVRTDANPATFAVLEFRVSDSATVYFDMVQLATSTVTDYHEARAIEVFLNPSKTNELKNPSFNPLGDEEWTVVAQDSDYVTPTTLTGGQYGEYMLRVDGTDDGLTSISANTDVVTTGKYYTFSIYARMEGLAVLTGAINNNIATVTTSAAAPWSVGQTVTIQNFAGISSSGEQLFSVFNGSWEILSVSGTTLTLALTSSNLATQTANEEARICRPETMTLRINSYDEAAESGDEVADIHDAEFTFTNDWARYSVTGFISANPNPVYLQASVFSETIGCVMDFDAAQVEASYRPTDYFDGGFPESYGAVWENGEHVSRSHLYPNKAIKVTRLAETLDKWIPINRAYTIKSYAGTEAKVV